MLERDRVLYHDPNSLSERCGGLNVAQRTPADCQSALHDSRMTLLIISVSGSLGVCARSVHRDHIFALRSIFPAASSTGMSKGAVGLSTPISSLAAQTAVPDFESNATKQSSFLCSFFLLSTEPRFVEVPSVPETQQRTSALPCRQQSVRFAGECSSNRVPGVVETGNG